MQQNPVSLASTLMLLGTEKSGVALEFLAADGSGGLPPDVLLHVSVAADGFTAVDDVWCHHEGLLKFLREFRSLEETRSGDAALNGMTPHTFRIRLFATDRAGHIAVEGHVQRGSVRVQRLGFELSLDSGMLGTYLADLEAFVALLETAQR
jgi:hypothetical protein